MCGVRGSQGNGDWVLRGRIIGIPGTRTSGGLGGLGEQSQSSECPSVWDQRETRKQAQTPGILTNQQDRGPGSGHPVMCGHHGSELHESHKTRWYRGLGAEDSNNRGQDWGNLGLKNLGPGRRIWESLGGPRTGTRKLGAFRTPSDEEMTEEARHHSPHPVSIPDLKEGALPKEGAVLTSPSPSDPPSDKAHA